MSTATFKPICLLMAGLAALTSPAFSQQFRTVSAMDALDQIRSRFGAGPVEWIAEMKATGGQPQPLQWDIVSYDVRSPGLLHHFRASSGIAQDGGPDTRRYPNDVPNGFFSFADITVDSVAAFTIAEAEARKAKQGFDSCDYFLQLREFSREAVWKLDLVDANHRLAGAVYISAANGAVLRTIWIKRDPITGFPQTIDSIVPGSRNFTGITNADQPIRGPINTDTGITGAIPQPPLDRIDPYAPVGPDGTIQPAPPAPSSSAIPRRSGIFKEFPASGGGGSTPIANMPPRNVPTEPSPPVVKIPGPETIATDPIDSIISGPPINVPSNGGSSARIPPPPVPQ